MLHTGEIFHSSSMGREWLNCRSQILNNRSQVAKACVSRSTVWTPFSTHLHLPSGQHKYLRAECSCEQSKPVPVKGHKFFPPHTMCLTRTTAKFLHAGATVPLLRQTHLMVDHGIIGSSPQVWQPPCALFAGNGGCCQNPSARLIPSLCISHNTSQRFKFYSYQILFPEAWCFQNIVFYHLLAEYFSPLWKGLHIFLKAASI